MPAIVAIFNVPADANLTVYNLFLVGYSLDSFVGIFDTRVGAQSTALANKLS